MNKIKQLYKDTMGILEIARHMDPVETWENTYMRRQYRKEIKRCSTISGIHFVMLDLNRGGKRLQVKAFDKLLELAKGRKEFLLREQGFVG